MSFKHDNQVGGNHYARGDKPQHWDLAIMYQWDVFQYQVTKYVMRWKDKHDTHAKRLEDLKKARSFLDKYIANAEKYDSRPTDAPAAQVSEVEPTTVKVVWEGNECPSSTSAHVKHQFVDSDFTLEGYSANGTALYKCRQCGWEGWHMANVDAHAAHGWHMTNAALTRAHGGCAGKGYVAQG